MDSVISVLLVEDDVPVATSICDLLTLLGFEVTWEADRAHAVSALCSNHQFHVVLLDLRLGTERGEQVIRDARAQKCSVPPIIIISAQPDAELHAAVASSCATGFLRKPCTANGIKTAIERAVA